MGYGVQKIKPCQHDSLFCLLYEVELCVIYITHEVLLCFVLQECTNIFSSGGGQSLASMAGIPFLGCVPIDPQVTVSGEKGQNSLRPPPDSPLFAVFQDIVKTITKPRVGTGDETVVS